MPLLEQVLKQNSNTVKIVFKNLPLKNHQMAGPAALAALAAGEQNKFWEYHDLLFAEPKINPDSLKRIAAKLGLDLARFETDMKSPAILAKLNKDTVEAEALGINSTPTVFVNGKALKERNFEGMQRQIDEALQNKKLQ